MARRANLLNLITGIALCAALAGCGGGSSSSSTSSTSNPVTITMVPGSANVTTGSTTQFTATVTNASNTAVTYQVNNVTGGNATTGTINTSGLYTAPAQVPNPNTVEIEAISQQDSSKKATASVTIQLPPPTTHIDISPAAPVVQTGAIQTFTAAINGQPANVTWTLNCSTPNGCGTITPTTGVYTAPLTPPLGGSVHLTATDNNPQDNTPPGGASITVQFSPGTLNGQYAFSVLGTGTAIAGTLTMNGNGVITGGSGDLNNNGAVSTFTVNASTYTLQTDGRGLITLNTSAGTFTFALATVNHSHGFLTRFDNGTAGAGTIDLQDPTKFATGTLAAVTGNYTIAFANHGSSLATQVAGAGAFGTNGGGGISNGKLDINNGSPSNFNMALSGSILAPNATTGRGNMSISSSFGAQNFAYYILDATHLKLIELDPSASLVTTGDLYQQSSGPFTVANFNGSFAVTLSGFTSTGPVGEGAVFSLDGTGNVKNGTFDLNQNGIIPTGAGASATGTYSVADTTTGRTTVSIAAGGLTLQYVAYPKAGGALNLLEIDSINTAGGTAFPQQSSAFSNTATFGNFALSATGVDLSKAAEQDMVGRWLPNGGTAFNGILDVNDGGTISPGTQNSLSGSYPAVQSNGRSPSGTMQASNFQPAATVNFYIVDANTVLFVEVDSNRVLTGTMQKQY